MSWHLLWAWPWPGTGERESHKVQAKASVSLYPVGEPRLTPAESPGMVEVGIRDGFDAELHWRRVP